LNSRDYIASGEISLLVLGLLSNDEEDAIWDAAKTDAGIMAAIRAAEEEMLEIDTVLGKGPAPELKNNLIKFPLIHQEPSKLNLKQRLTTIYGNLRWLHLSL
jgi:hypothetical protein